MRAPIMLSPRRSAWSLNGVPLPGIALGLLSGASALLLLILLPVVLFVVPSAMVAFAAIGRIADRRRRRPR
jgi:hypothetical protein